MQIQPVHPFPARMAPEIALDFLGTLAPATTVLDPMCGSGVALRSAVMRGHKAIGCDLDPLAVLMSKVWTEQKTYASLVAHAEHLVGEASRRRSLTVPWHQDQETAQFVRFWFGLRQRKALARLALTLHKRRDDLPRHIVRGLQLAISRLIVTKSRGASLAWDVSHSRPHIKKDSNDFDVATEFVSA